MNTNMNDKSRDMSTKNQDSRVRESDVRIPMNNHTWKVSFAREMISAGSSFPSTARMSNETIRFSFGRDIFMVNNFLLFYLFFYNII